MVFAINVIDDFECFLYKNRTKKALLNFTCGASEPEVSTFDSSIPLSMVSESSIKEIQSYYLIYGNIMTLYVANKTHLFFHLPAVFCFSSASSTVS